MTQILRTEEWTKEVDWGTTTLVVYVYEGDKVHVSPEFVHEMGFNPDKAKEIVPEFSQHFVHEFGYEEVAERLREDGWTHASTS